MTVIDRTEGGYTKVETKNGVTRYHDPNGHPTKQQAFAASKGQERRENKITERKESGEIQDTEVTTDDDDDDDDITVPAELYRVTIAANRDYSTRQVPSPGWESWTITFESTTFRYFENRSDALDAGKDKLNNIADLASEQIDPVNDVRAKSNPNAELSVEATEADGNFRQWSDTELTIEFSGGGLDGWSESYDLDVENEKIKWQ